MNQVHEFRTELEQAGLMPSEVVPDGILRRCPTQDKPKDKSGWYVCHDDPPAGAFGDWRTGEQRTWSGNGGDLDPESKRRMQERIEAARREREAEEAKKHAQAAVEAQRILESLPDATPETPYFKRKGVTPCPGIKEDSGTGVVPVHGPDGRIQSLQRIDADGDKRFLPGGKVGGGFFPVNKSGKGPLIICEGIATGLSISEADGTATVLCAFTAGNLEAVSRMARERYPERPLIVARDDDHATKGNLGRTKGNEAALLTKAKVAAPSFLDPQGKSDFNDMMLEQGIEAVKKALDGAQDPEPTQAPPIVRALTIHEFLTYEFPPRAYVLSPIIPTQGLVLLYAFRGIGKTLISLHIAYAVATGQAVCRWTAPQARRVLYLDGEMPGAVMQERVAGIVRSYPVEPDPDFFRIVSPDLQDRSLNLATLEGQGAVAPLLDGVELVIVDNLATLSRAGRENETESWHPIQDWILSLRRRGLSVLLVHHANKSGGQRGTSSREDVLDTVISLRRPSDYHMDQGARFEVHLDKARGLIGNDAKPFEAMLSNDENGALVWTCRDIEDAELEMVLRLAKEGSSVRDIAKETGLSKSKVHRLLKKAGMEVKS